MAKLAERIIRKKIVPVKEDCREEKKRKTLITEKKQLTNTNRITRGKQDLKT